MQSKSTLANVTIEGDWAAAISSPAGRRLRQCSLRGGGRKRKSERRVHTPGRPVRAVEFQASAFVPPVRPSEKARVVIHDNKL